MNSLMRIQMKNLYRSPVYLISYLCITFLLVGVVAFLGNLLLLRPMIEEGRSEDALLVFGLMVYAIGLLLLGLYWNVFFARPFALEKNQGILENMLAAPLEPRQLWLSRFGAIFLPGVLVTVAGVFLFFGAMSLAYPGLLSRGQVFWILLSSVLGLPLLYGGLGMLGSLISLQGRASSGNVLFQIFFPCFTALIINLGIRGVLRPDRPFFFSLHAIVGVILGSIVLMVVRGLSKEKIVLSGGSA